MNNSNVKRGDKHLIMQSLVQMVSKFSLSYLGDEAMGASEHSRSCREHREPDRKLRQLCD